MKNFTFPTNLEERHYSVFSEKLENDDLTFFHGTHLDNLDSIEKNGFWLPNPNGDNPLRGVSFTCESAFALSFAMYKRKSYSGDYCIIAVQYPSLEYPHICPDGSCIIHDYQLAPQPQQVGFSIVPESYQFV